MIDIKKYQLHDHVYSSSLQAAATGESMGLGREFHVYQVDGQAYYMPGRNHEDYLRAMGHDEPESVEESRMVEALRAVVAEIMNKSDFHINAPVIKVDKDAKVIWGWAYVCTEKGEKAFDRSGEWIAPETLVKATTNFMLTSRMAKVNHIGPKEGDIVGSLPVTKDLADALGIQTDREGWIIGVVASDDTLAKVESGELTSFSIGGRALKRSM